jgi:2-polyprenyl-6-methoxyphenol hydroxylase-like FAD-dependent oxidoreductase
MLITAKHTQVLIVGAGPSGLMMAAQLLRYGIQPIIIDSKDGPTTHSKALAVQARSLEIYRQMGIADTAVADGAQTRGIVFNRDGKQQASLSLSSIGDGLTPFPYILMYPQSKNERLLLDYLTVNCCPIYWNTTLTSLTQKTHSVKVSLKTANTEFDLDCYWVVGADGAHSMVRKQTGQSFSGDTYANSFYLIDAQLDAPGLTGDYLNMFLDTNNFCGFFPMPDKDTYRILGNLPDQFNGQDMLTAEQLLPYINTITKKRIKITQENLLTTYKLHHRIADNFRAGRCFLIGDAAHIHSPVGGQGMNTGLQDGYNLAWKLAGVINNQLKPCILDSYAKERMPVAKTLLKTTDATFNVIISRNIFISLFKKAALFRLLNTLWKSDALKTMFFKKVSQIDINYRDSKINLHLSKSTKIKAGDRLPYLRVYDEKLLVETDLHEWCNKPGFTLLILGKFDELFLFSIAKWITLEYTGLLNFFYLPPSGKNLDVFEAFECNPHQQKALIIRPDMYIGYMNDVVDMGMMDNYLRNVAMVDGQ